LSINYLGTPSRSTFEGIILPGIIRLYMFFLINLVIIMTSF